MGLDKGLLALLNCSCIILLAENDVSPPDELECLRLEDERRQEEENKKLQEMDESERIEYLCRKKQEEEDRKNKEEERKRIEEEAALQAAEENRLQTELLTRYTLSMVLKMGA